MSQAAPAPRPQAFPGFDGIRLLAAWAVVFSHSYPIALGPHTPDPLISRLGDFNGLGDYAVRVFFILSGFLLTASLDHSFDPLRYLVSRALRLVPGFCFATMVSVLLLAPLLTVGGYLAMWRSPEAWSSIGWSINGLSDSVNFTMPLVRFPDFAGFLNGSLWSIPYELGCYLLLLALYLLLRRDARVGLAALVLASVSLAGPQLGFATTNWAEAGNGRWPLPLVMFDSTLPYFCGGVAWYAAHKRWGTTPWVALAAAIALALSVVLRLHDFVLAIAGPPILVYLGMQRTWLSRLTERLGDVSYGVYLFGWPAALVVGTRLGLNQPLAVFCVAVPVVLVLAYAMRVLVETPVADGVKPWLFRKLPRCRVGQGQWPASLPWRERALKALAYAFVLVMMLRFVIFPYAGGANWFGYQTVQLVGICAVIAVMCRAMTARP